MRIRAQLVSMVSMVPLVHPRALRGLSLHVLCEKHSLRGSGRNTYTIDTIDTTVGSCAHTSHAMPHQRRDHLAAPALRLPNNEGEPLMNNRNRPSYAKNYDLLTEALRVPGITLGGHPDAVDLRCPRSGCASQTHLYGAISTDIGPRPWIAEGRHVVRLAAWCESYHTFLIDFSSRVNGTTRVETMALIDDHPTKRIAGMLALAEKENRT